MKRIIKCPGQGAQNVGMGKSWFEKSDHARRTFLEADGIVGSRLGAPLTSICFEGPADRLNRTDVSQPAIFVTSVACWHGVLEAHGSTASEFPLAATLGLSLGEYTALHLAGAIDFHDALELVTLRGRAMQDAAEAQPGGMVALIGGTEEQAMEVCDKARGTDILVCANFNAPGQIVLSGSKPACDRAVEVAQKMGLRATALAVAGAFHSPLMAAAADRLREALARTQIKAPRVPVISNVTARPHEPGEGEIAQTIRDLLVEQLTSPVRWSESCQEAISRWSGSPLHELAPGRTLAGLMRRIEKSAKVTSHDEPESSA